MDTQTILAIIGANADEHAWRKPNERTLQREVDELKEALQGIHEDPPELELVQIGGIVVNMLRKYTPEQIEAAFVVRNQRKAAELFISDNDFKEWLDFEERQRAAYHDFTGA